MKTVYRCTHITKEVQRWDKKAGATGEDRQCVMNESVCFTASTIPKLLDMIRSTYGLDLDDLYIPGDDDEVEWFDYNRLEDNDGGEPFPAQTDGLWLADYSFEVEKGTVGPVPLDELKAVVKTH